ncbi:Multidrug resistance protein MexA precursor [Pseudooceanicola marinus]|uniref:Multidrug resistance protein MexA n=1 Tax=Pseudooceanicola marinus TaxID=396013 RepID=A0A1X6ZXS6_9RHOB|nr:efflux RND transporter periplasmic adaptor subunit [Pseudooceanicola marinus]PJE30040.1 efflux RND transporter periplasmic adaptor subunit [Pseudooceanicola marinus]SLN64703.1 Multidrug resistance protein MexA precursor [Pseudooceanicola marinus]
MPRPASGTSAAPIHCPQGVRPVRRLGATLLSLGLLLHAVPAWAQFGGGGPTEVGVVALEMGAAPYQVVLPGRAVAHDQTEIRPRVEGLVEEIPYRAGTRVEAGALLFRLETDTYDVALAAAEAQLASAQATETAAQAQVDRYERLEGVGSTQSDLDQARAELASARASVKAAESSLKSARLNLERTEIRSPIAGIVDLAQVSEGALVTANQSQALTTVTTIDPIYVDVQESSARMLRVRKRLEEGSLTRTDDLDIGLVLETGDTYEGQGRMVSPRSEVSTTTGTVDFRIEFDNPERVILPGQFLRVTITLGETQAILVPQRATSRGSDGSLTAFVAEGDTARRVTLTAQGTWQNAWIVTEGVAQGDQLIVDGLQNLRDGAAISTVPVTINAAGLVEDQAAADGDADVAAAGE